MTTSSPEPELFVFTASDEQTSVLRSAREAWAYRDFIAYLTKRQLRMTYLRSYLGWFWSLLNPIAEVAIYSLVFGYILAVGRGIPEAPNGFSSFPHFLVAGLAVWGYFRSVSAKVLTDFSSTVKLRRKLYFPPVAPAIAEAINTSIQSSTLVIVVIAFFAAWGHLSIHAIVVVPAALFAALTGLGTGLLLSVANSRYRDVGYLYSIFLRLFFYFVPIIWPIEMLTARVGDGWMKNVVSWNPFTRMVGFARDGLIYFRWPPAIDWIYLSVFSLGVLWLGWAIFARTSADVAEGL